MFCKLCCAGSFRTGRYPIQANARQLSCVHDTQQLRHLIVEEAFAGAVRLHPLTINHELRNGALAGVADDLLGRAGRALNIDLGERNVVLLEEALSGAAVGDQDEE